MRQDYGASVSGTMIDHVVPRIPWFCGTEDARYTVMAVPYAVLSTTQCEDAAEVYTPPNRGSTLRCTELAPRYEDAAGSRSTSDHAGREDNTIMLRNVDYSSMEPGPPRRTSFFLRSTDFQLLTPSTSCHHIHDCLKDPCSCMY